MHHRLSFPLILLIFLLCFIFFSDSRTPAYIKAKQKELEKALGLRREGMPPRADDKSLDDPQNALSTAGIQQSNDPSDTKLQVKGRTPAYIKELLKSKKKLQDPKNIIGQFSSLVDSVNQATNNYSSNSLDTGVGGVQTPAVPYVNFGNQSIASIMSNNNVESKTTQVPDSPILKEEIIINPVKIKPTGLESAGIQSPSEDKQHTERLNYAILKFLNNTSIHKEIGLYSLTSKNFAADGFNPDWELFHLRHVCVKGGTDGLYMGNLTELNPSDVYFKDSLTLSDWNQLMTTKDLLQIQGKLFDPSLHEISKIRHIKGSTFFMNCLQSEIDSLDTHHSKLLRKIGLLYELAKIFQVNAEKTFGSSLFSEAMKLPLSQIFFHQCGNPQESNWSQEILNLTFSHLKDNNLLSPNFIDPLSKEYDFNSKANHLICFDDVYTSVRSKWWIQGLQHQRSMRMELMSHFKQKKLLSDMIDETQDSETIVGRQNYCPQVLEGKSNARIKIFQHDTDGVSAYDRNFMNTEEVIRMAQSFTSEPVTVITLNSSSPIAEQIELFNSFDLLITPSGDHLTNGVFTIKPHAKAVIEVVAFLSDNTSFINYQNELGFADYVISSGHLTPVGSNVHCPFRTESEYGNRHCFLHKEKHIPNKLKQSVLMCHSELQLTSDCKIHVNINFLRRHIDLLFKKVLCKGSPDSIASSNFSSLVSFNHSREEEEHNRLIYIHEQAYKSEAMQHMKQVDGLSRNPLIWISSITDLDVHFEHTKRMWAVAESYGRRISVVWYKFNNESIRICDFFEFPNSINCMSKNRIDLLKNIPCTRLDMDGLSPSYAYNPISYGLSGEFNLADLHPINWISSDCVVGIPMTSKFIGDPGSDTKLPLKFTQRTLQLYDKAMNELELKARSMIVVQWIRKDPSSSECKSLSESLEPSDMSIKCANLENFVQILGDLLQTNLTSNVFVTTNELNRKELKGIRSAGYKVLNAGRYIYTPVLKYLVELRSMVFAGTFISWHRDSATKKWAVSARDLNQISILPNGNSSGENSLGAEIYKLPNLNNTNEDLEESEDEDYSVDSIEGSEDFLLLHEIAHNKEKQPQASIFTIIIGFVKSPVFIRLMIIILIIVFVSWCAYDLMKQRSQHISSSPSTSSNKNQTSSTKNIPPNIKSRKR